MAASTVSPSTPDNSYHNASTGNWVTAARRVDLGIRLCERFNGVVLEWAQLEEDYAGRLSQLAQKIVTSPLESRAIQHAFQSLRNSSQQRSRQAVEFSECLRQDVSLETLGPLITHQNQQYRLATMEANEKSKYIENVQALHKESMYRYESVGREAYDASEKCQMAEKQGPHYRTHLSVVAIRKCREVKKAYQEYEKNTDLLNSLQKKYSTQFKQTFKRLQELDFHRISNLKDALRKIMVYQTSYLRNMQYDLSTVANCCEGIDTQMESRNFVEECKSLYISQAPLELKSWVAISKFSEYTTPTQADATLDDKSNTGSLFQRFQLNKVVQLATSHLTGQGNRQQSIKNEPEMPSPPSDKVFNKIEEDFEKFLDTLWDGQIHEVEALSPIVSEDSFQTSFKRYVFCKCLEKRCSAPRLPSAAALRFLGKRCHWVLNSADHQMDVWSGRSILYSAKHISAFGTASDFAITITEEVANDTFPTSKCKSLWTLHYILYHHQYWNRVSFWEEALMLTISEDLQLQMFQEKWALEGEEVLQTETSTFYKKNPCVTSASSFCHEMLNFGISSSRIIQLFHKVFMFLDLRIEHLPKFVEGFELLKNNSDVAMYTESKAKIEELQENIKEDKDEVKSDTQNIIAKKRSTDQKQILSEMPKKVIPTQSTASSKSNETTSSTSVDAVCQTQNFVDKVQNQAPESSHKQVSSSIKHSTKKDIRDTNDSQEASINKFNTKHELSMFDVFGG